MWNWRRGPAGAAGFRCEEKPLVCGDGLAPLSSVGLLATVTPQPAGPQICLPNLLALAGRAELCRTDPPHPAAAPWWLRQHC